MEDVGYIADMLEENPDFKQTKGIAKITRAQTLSSCLSVLDSALQTFPGPVLSSLIYSPIDDDEAEGGGAGDQGLVSKACKIFSFNDLSLVNFSAGLGELGMDSLLLAEMKQLLLREHNLTMSTSELRKLTFTNLEQIQNGEFKTSSWAREQDWTRSKG